MKATEIIALAAKHIKPGTSGADSAKLCLDDAEALLSRGLVEEARARALRSLQYSVGVFHEDYKAARQLLSN